jgi:hypothetical protein
MTEIPRHGIQHRLLGERGIHPHPARRIGRRPLPLRRNGTNCEVSDKKLDDEPLIVFCQSPVHAPVTRR